MVNCRFFKIKIEGDLLLFVQEKLAILLFITNCLSILETFPLELIIQIKQKLKNNVV